MDSTRWTIVGAVSLSMVAVGIFWTTLPEAGPPPPPPPPPVPEIVARPAPPPAVRPSPAPSRARGERRGARAQRNPAAAPGEGPRAAKTRPRGEDLGDREVPEDVLAMIEEVRAERVASSTEKLATYAELAAWDEQTTANVQGMVAAAHDEVDALIEDATTGEVPWTDVRNEVRRIRVDQARAVRDELGEDEFRRFATAMGRAGRRGRGRGGPR